MEELQLDEQTEGEIDDPNLKKISIHVTGYKHFVPVYKSSIITVTASFLNEELGPPQSHAFIYKDYTPVEMLFELKYNKALPSDLDKLITAPVLFTVTEIEIPEEVEVQVPQVDIPKEEIPGEIDYEDDPDEIALRQTMQLQEAYTGVVTKREDLMPRKEVKKLKKEREALVKKLKKGKGGEVAVSETDLKKEEEKPKGPILIGTSSLDLLPFFLGKTEIVELLALKRVHAFSIAESKSIANTPYIEVKAAIDDMITKIEDSNILNLTIEAFYNVPSVMTPELNYSIAVDIPIMETENEPLIFDKYRFCTARNLVTRKLWYTRPDLDIDLPLSSYKIEQKASSIKNRAKADLDFLIGKEVPRIEYNVLKRTFMKDTVLVMFQQRLRKYRTILFEIYITPKVNKPNGASNKDKAKSEKSSKGKDKKEDVDKAEKEEAFLHLMAFAELNSLLHPGVQKCRIACQLQTYHEEEIVKKIGEYNSVFRPKKLPTVDTAPSTPVAKGKKDKKEKSETKQSKKDKAAESKKSSDKSRTVKSGMADKLPAAPVPVVVEPSKLVYDEFGKPTFLLVDFELMHPLVPARSIEDLSQSFHEFIPEYPRYAKLVNSITYAESYFRETVRQLLEDINKQYQKFMDEIESAECKCDRDELSFISFLHQEGAYKTYFSTVQKATSLVVSSKYPELTNTNKNTSEYQYIVSDVYTYLMNEMNKLVNLMALCDEERPPVLPIDQATSKLFYAKEACELGAYDLARKYHLQRLNLCDSNADYWFDYAVYHVEIDQLDKAKECLKEALALDSVHRNSLILFGTLLFEERKFRDAEILYFILTAHEPRLVEGWCLLHLLYEQTEDLDGQEHCMEMINKYANENGKRDNYFFSDDDLAWSANIVPKTPFFKLATVLIKLRTIQTANRALAHEIAENTDYCQYLIGVALYYNKSYASACCHINQAVKLYGFDYIIGGMLGHCMLQVGRYEKAAEVYGRILQSDDRPDDIHLIYVKAAIAFDRINDDQYARKLLLLACKYRESPYTWLGAGLMYFNEKDMVSAEACFGQANALDNLLPEIWAYLCLVNLELGRQCEAQMCYRQAIRNELDDPELLQEIKSKMNQSQTIVKFNMGVEESESCGN